MFQMMKIRYNAKHKSKNIMVKLVGILNLTPDSFSDGGQNSSLAAALRRTREMFDQGAAIVDVGAESTRPGAEALSWQKEVGRLKQFIEAIKSLNFNISLDTYHPQTVEWVNKELSGFIINDVTGFRDPAMRQIAARSGQRVILSHFPQSSPSIQAAHREKPVDSVEHVLQELRESIKELLQAGVAKDKIIVDPGIGFGKTKRLNWQLLQFASYLPEYEVMIGYSRKRFLGEGRFELLANYTAGQIAAESGAKYLRVHDVAGHASLI